MLSSMFDRSLLSINVKHRITKIYAVDQSCLCNCFNIEILIFSFTTVRKIILASAVQLVMSGFQNMSMTFSISHLCQISQT